MTGLKSEQVFQKQEVSRYWLDLAWCLVKFNTGLHFVQKQTNKQTKLEIRFCGQNILQIFDWRERERS